LVKITDSIILFLTRFSVQAKIIFLVLFLTSGVVFWNVSYFSVAKKTEESHNKAIVDFKKIETVATILKKIQSERFNSIMYLNKNSNALALQAIWNANNLLLKKLQTLHFRDISAHKKMQTILENLKELAETRQNVLKHDYEEDDIIRFYTDGIIKHLLDITHILAQQNNIKTILAYSDLVSAIEYTALNRDLTLSVMQNNLLNIDWFEMMSMLDARAQSYFNNFKLNADKTNLQYYYHLASHPYFIKINMLKQSIRDQFSKDNLPNTFSAKEWYQNTDTYIDDLYILLQKESITIQKELSKIHKEDIKEQRKNLALLLIPLTLTLIIALYLFIDIRVALSIILSYLKGDDATSQNRKTILLKANNEFGQVYRALLQYNDDINKQMEINKHTYEYDSLTSLPNRIKLIQVLDNNIRLSQKQTLFYVDILNFSHVNTSFGQYIGDIFLKESANILLNIVHEVTQIDAKHSLFRTGSDEFVIICHSMKNRDEIITQLQRTFLVACEDVIIPLSFTFGISEMSSDKDISSSLLLSHSEIATNHAKSNHKHFEVFNESMIREANHKENLEWIKKISNAFEQGLFEVHYQPIILTQTQELVKYEVLIRMRDAQNDAIISPGEFLEILQKSGHEKDLTKVIIEQSFQSFEHCGVDLSINMISDDLDYEMVEYLINKADQYNIDPQHITIELVESEELLKEHYIAIIQKIKSYGFKLAIDDFGTGYSNFAYLTQIKPDYIKVDGSLVRDICENEQHARVVEGIFDFSQSLGIETIAEFVSGEAIYNRIKEIGIEYVQGFYLGKVMSCNEIKAKKEEKEA